MTPWPPTPRSLAVAAAVVVAVAVVIVFGSTAYIFDDVDKCLSKCLLVLAFEFAILVWIPSFCPSVSRSVVTVVR